MSILKMEELTWKEIDKLSKEKSVIIVALSPIEEHGPHLPLGTDYISAKDLLEAVVTNLEKQNNKYNYIIHPAFPIGYNECIMNYPGTISYRAKTIENLLVDFGESIAKAGFNKIVIVNHHLDLGHIKAIENAQKLLNINCKLKVLEIASSIIYSESGEKDTKATYEGINMENEVHADFRETSFMLFKHPELVKENYNSLASVYLDVEEFVKSGRRYWTEGGVKEGYIGSPAKASVENGKKLFKDMVKRTVELIFNFVKYDKIPELSKEIKTAMNYMDLR